MAYERVNWENLPSTKTPINQTNLNKMENGIDQAGAEIFVGAEEPTTGEKVWFRKGKNKFNPNDKTNGYLNINGSPTSATDWTCSGFIEINSNKYILSANTTAKRVIWCEYDSSMNIIGTRHEVAYGNPIAIVSTNTKYIKVCFNDGTATDIQLEQGSKATSYEAYIEPKIYVRNSNGVYEEFTKKSEEVYSTEEQRIGTWIDGKPLYRKVIDFGALPSSPLYKYVNHNIQNISQIVFLDGFCIDSSSEWAFPVNCIRPNTANSNIGCYASKTQIVIECGVNRSSYRAYITLEYTKTTD